MTFRSAISVMLSSALNYQAPLTDDDKLQRRPDIIAKSVFKLGPYYKHPSLRDKCKVIVENKKKKIKKKKKRSRILVRSNFALFGHGFSFPW